LLGPGLQRILLSSNDTLGARYMGLRIRRSIRLGRGVRLNLAKGGVSLSVGGRGLTQNFSRRGVRTTLGIPGTGISYSTSNRSAGRGGGSGSGVTAAIALAVVLVLLLLASL